MRKLIYHIILYLLIFLIPNIINAQEKCDSFKEGTFVAIKNGIPIARIRRRKDIQMEKMDKSGTIDKYHIIWKDKCSYMLVYEESSNFKETLVQRGDTIFTNILDIRNDTCWYQSRYKKMTVNGIMKKVRNENH